MARGSKMPLDDKTLLRVVKEAKEKSGDRKFTQTVDLLMDIQEIDMKSPEGFAIVREREVIPGLFVTELERPGG